MSKASAQQLRVFVVFVFSLDDHRIITSCRYVNTLENKWNTGSGVKSFEQRDLASSP